MLFSRLWTLKTTILSVAVYLRIKDRTPTNTTAMS